MHTHTRAFTALANTFLHCSGLTALLKRCSELKLLNVGSAALQQAVEKLRAEDGVLAHTQLSVVSSKQF